MVGIYFTSCEHKQGGVFACHAPCIADDKYTRSHRPLKVGVTNSLNTFSSENMFHRDETRPKCMYTQ